MHQRVAQGGGDRPGVAVHPPGDRGQARRAVVAGVHRGHHRQQHLRGADVGRRLVAADVLLAGLQRQPVGRVPVTVHRHPHQAARQLPGVFGVHGQVAGVRAAEAHRHTESLCGAEGDVGADLTGGGHQRQRQQVGAHRHQRTTLVRALDQGGPVGDPAAGPRQLGDHTEELAVGQAVPQVGGDDLDAQRLGAGRQDRAGLGEDVDIDGQPPGVTPHGPVHQRHGLGGGGALVEHRSVGDLQAGQVGHHGLEVQQRLEPALADLRLVRRVRGVPGRVFEDVAQQYRRGQRVVVALPDHGHRDGVGIGHCAQFGERLVLGRRGRQAVEPRRRACGVQRVQDVGGQCLGREFVEGGDADDVEHGCDGGAVGADVAIGKSVGRRRSGGHRGLLAQRGTHVPPPLSSTRAGRLRDSAGSAAFPHGRAGRVFTTRNAAFQRHRGLTRSGGLRG